MTKTKSDKIIGNPDAESLISSARAASKGGLPPVHLWNPPFCGDLDMRIARDGTWFYQGTPIGRPELVRLFSSILKIEDGNYFLVTPVEKVGIRVDDAPFVAVDAQVSGKGRDQSLRFTTQVDEEVTAGPEHRIDVRLDPETGEPSPYLHVRSGLNALIDRKTFYRLIDIGVVEDIDDDAWFGLWSEGEFFPIQKQAELDVE